jgi:hypothetical protein
MSEAGANHSAGRGAINLVAKSWGVFLMLPTSIAALAFVIGHFAHGLRQTDQLSTPPAQRSPRFSASL